MQILRDNGLTIVLSALTIVTIAGMVTGWSVHNEEIVQLGGTALSLSDYAASGHFLSAIFENWESEFLQMSAYVTLTAILFQRGSAESKDPDETASRGGDAALKAADRALLGQYEQVDYSGRCTRTHWASPSLFCSSPASYSTFATVQRLKTQKRRCTVRRRSP